MDKEKKEFIFNAIGFGVSIINILLLVIVGAASIIFLSTDTEALSDTINFIFWDVDSGFFVGAVSVFFLWGAWWLRTGPIYFYNKLRGRHSDDE